jgi:nicotinamidase-related amidase
MRITWNVPFLRGCVVAIALVVAVLGLGRTARADIIDEWSTLAIPAPPALKAVQLDAPTTALLMLDFLPSDCGTSPRCVALLPKVRSLLDAARAAKALVVYTEYPPNTLSSVLPQVAAQGSEPNFIAVADKFINTDLDQLLKSKGIKTLVIVGVVANGAVLNTASDAAQRGYKVVVAVDGMSGMSPYAEAYTATQLTTAPTVANNVTLTRTGMVKF